MLTRLLLITGISFMLIVIYFSCEIPRPLASSLIPPVPAAGNQYYNNRTARYLGKDNADTVGYRLIDPEIYNNILKTDTGKEAAHLLRDSSRLITINDIQIQTDLQWVRDMSLLHKIEYQIYIYIDLQTGHVSSLQGKPGTNRASYLEVKSRPDIGVIYAVVHHHQMLGWILIGQVHGHPPATELGIEAEEEKMSPVDSATAVFMQMPVYAIDAMKGDTGDQGWMTRANPNLKNTIADQSQEIGKTWGKQKYAADFHIDIGLDALLIWGITDTPDFWHIDSLTRALNVTSPDP